MAATYLKDGRILWLQVPLVGTPPTWAPGTNYKLGDVVVPTTNVTPGFMFQCVGFLGRSGSVQPTFPLVLGNTVVDGNIIWTAADPSANPPPLKENEYFEIAEVVSAS